MINLFGDGTGMEKTNINASDSLHTKLLIGIGLSILVLIAYWGVTGNGFVNYDDQAYVSWNRHVQKGLTLEGIAWAFTTTSVSNWHPLTWLSLMLDLELYGMNAGGYHWTSVVLHMATGLFLFLVLIRMTGQLWRSGVVAGLFLIHPLHVESVAWVAERKDVLSGLFWMSSMWGYARYVEKPLVGRYLWVVLFFVLGLMSKPMVVTLPFVLLLLDYWPLGRMERGTVVRLLYEKAPLFFLSAASSVITFIAQKEGEAVASLQHLPFTDRLGNAVVAYATYLVKTILPYDLAIYYTHPGRWPVGEILFALALLLLITVLFVMRSRRSPYLAVGWFWYLGTLVPVIGLVQVGGQAMADRYTYLPLVGIFIAIVWGFAELLTVGRYRMMIGSATRKTCIVGGDERCNKKQISSLPGSAALWAGSITSGLVIVVVMTALICMTQIQVGYWKSSITLFSHALRVTKDNFQAHNNLARALTDEKRYQEAQDHYLASIRISPSYMPPYVNLGLMQMELGMLEEAMICFSEALKIKPGDGDALFAIGNLYLKKGLWDKAIVQYRMALNEKPSDSTLHNNLGLALTRRGDVDQAIRSYQTAIQLDPEHAGAHNNLAMLLMGEGNNREAVDHFRQAIGYQPDYWNAHFQLAKLLSLEGLADEAAYHLREARRINPDVEKLPEQAIPEVDTRTDMRFRK
ncbi:MAG TPA: hypothetical protein DCZ97_00595 [Syntrophus sp. (in: bacteria)]|nr:hypothetical protein [Syntrophus sp. (in: bacteria)]